MGADVLAAIEKSQNAADGHAAAEAYQTIFKGLSDDDLRVLLVYEDDSIAIRAAWERVVRSVYYRGHTATRSTQYLLHPGALERFISFVEGRMGTQIPSLWIDAISTADVNKEGSVAFSIPSVLSYDEHAQMYHDKEIDIEYVGASICITAGRDTTCIPKAVLKPQGAADRLVYINDGDMIYIGVYDDAGSSFKVSCVKRSDGTVFWTSTVWAAQTWYGFGGFGGEHTCTFIVEKGHLIVFGQSSAGTYIESFDCSTGSRDIQFSTNM